MTDRSRVVNHPNHPTPGLRIESGRSDLWSESDRRTVGPFQGSPFGQIFLLCPTDGRAEVQNFGLSDREPSRAELSNCPKISRLSAWLSSTFSDKFGQSNNRIPKTLGAFLGQINVFFRFSIIIITVKLKTLSLFVSADLRWQEFNKILWKNIYSQPNIPI